MKVRITYLVRSLVFLCALSSLFTTGCSDKIADPNQKLLALEGKVRFNVYLSPVMDAPQVGFGNSYWISLETEKSYPCYNWLLASTLTEVTVGEDSTTYLTVTIRGIEQQEACLRAVGPARQRFEFVQIPPSGATLRFKYGRTIDVYRLSFGDYYQVVVEPIRTSFTVYSPETF